MWKIYVEKINKKYMFTDLFIRDLLEWICNNPDMISDSKDFLKTILIGNRLLPLAENYGKLRRLMIQLSQRPDRQQIWDAYQIYTSNYKEILNGTVQAPILNQDSHQLVKQAFEYFYDYLLDQPLFWETYNKGNNFITKSEFRELIGLKNKVCPYCDTAKVTDKNRTNLDHFLPISKFPLLGIHWENLVLSCVTCNTILVKGDNIFFPINHPFIDQTADQIKFTFDATNKKIGCNAATIMAENFIKLFKLEANYKNDWDKVDFTHELIVEYIIQQVKGEGDIGNIALVVSREVRRHKKILYRFIRRKENTKLNIDYCDYFKTVHTEKIAKFLMIEGDQQRTS